MSFTPDPGAPLQRSDEEISQFLEAILPELKRRARALMRNERVGSILQPTALVSEAFVRLFTGSPIPWDDTPRLIQAASAAMRNALIDHARWNRRKKRQSHLAVPLADDLPAYSSDPDRLIALDAALAALEKKDPRAAAIVQMRYFGGLEHAEIAEVLGLNERTVKRGWSFARLWLLKYLTGGDDNAAKD